MPTPSLGYWCNISFCLILTPAKPHHEPCDAQLLLEKGANPNDAYQSTEEKQTVTPLISAALSSCSVRSSTGDGYEFDSVRNTLKLLLAAGANPIDPRLSRPAAAAWQVPDNLKQCNTPRACTEAYVMARMQQDCSVLGAVPQGKKCQWIKSSEYGKGMCPNSWLLVWKAQEEFAAKGKVSLSSKVYDTTTVSDAFAYSVIPGHDIACGQLDPKGKPSPSCYVCWGRDAVESACDKQPRCVAYDYNLKSRCGYLKSAKGPLAKDPKQETYTMWQYPKSPATNAVTLGH
jgi:hypothetical protein